MNYIPYVLLLLAALSSAAHGELTFAGSQTDDDSQLNFMRARYYDAQTGTYLSKDPLGKQQQGRFSMFHAHNIGA